MAQLAIKGHATRGYEVIKILEMLGGKIPDKGLRGNELYYAYHMYDSGCIGLTHCSLLKNAIVFTLEEFTEKFPYKIGDKVIDTKTNRIAEIYKVHWSESNNRTYYDIKYINNTGCVRSCVFLQPYEEEHMKGKIESFEIVESHCADEVKIEFDPSKFEMVKRENGYYVAKKQPQYPKTYEECCKNVFGLAHEGMVVDIPMHYSPLIINFAELLICRDAYWKIAGEQMGLGKPWESNPSNEEQHKYAIYNYEGIIAKNDFWLTGVNTILVFPTEEMRDTFLDNFKELIKECISLL